MDIKREIVEYIRGNEINGALLITGKWGCGKTYMIKEIAKEFKDGDECAIAIVSLFGVDSVATLNDRVKAEYLERNSSFFSKSAIKVNKALGKVVKTSADAMSETSAGAAISAGVSIVAALNPMNYLTIKNTVGTRDKKRQFALIFDDLERSNICIKDLLGAINEYVENREIKTILVADEAKIEQECYAEFKEKLIARTLTFSADYTSIIKSILEGYKESYLGYVNFLKKNIDTIHQVFAESKSGNFRSLKAYLIDFERVFAAWNKTSVSQENMKSVFYMFGALTFGVKSGKYKEGEYGYLFADNELKETHSDWESAHILLSTRNWIVTGTWDENEFVEELRNKYRADDLSDDQKFLAYTFWDLEQKYITEGMPIAVQKAYAGELTRDELLDLLRKIFVLKKNSIPLPCEVDYDRIDAGFNGRKRRILLEGLEEPKFHRYAERSEIEETAFSIYENIKGFEDEKVLFSNKMRFCQYLKRETKVPQYSLKGSPIGAVDRDLANLFLAEYYKAENYLRREMIRTFLDLGHVDNWLITENHRRITIESIKYLVEEIDKHTTQLSDYIAIAINNNFVQRLLELSKKISNDGVNEDRGIN